jgi:hypothetical protein
LEKIFNETHFLVLLCLQTHTQEEVEEFIKDHECQSWKNPIGIKICDEIVKYTKAPKKLIERLYAVCKENAFQATIPIDIRVADYALYKVASKFNNMCVNNNCEWYVDPFTCAINVYALRDIKKGEELTIRYLSSLHICTPDMRRNEIMDRLGFECQCQDCVDGVRQAEFIGVNVDECTDEHMDPYLVKLCDRFSQENFTRCQIILKLIIDKYGKELSTDRNVAFNVWQKLSAWSETILEQAFHTKVPVASLCLQDVNRLDVIVKSFHMFIQDINLEDKVESGLFFRASVALLHLTPLSKMTPKIYENLAMVCGGWALKHRCETTPVLMHLSSLSMALAYSQQLTLVRLNKKK